MVPVGKADRRSSRQAVVTGGTIVTFLLGRCFSFPAAALVDGLSSLAEPGPCKARCNAGLSLLGAVE